MYSPDASFLQSSGTASPGFGKGRSSRTLLWLRSSVPSSRRPSPSMSSPKSRRPLPLRSSLMLSRCPSQSLSSRRIPSHPAVAVTVKVLILPDVERTVPVQVLPGVRDHDHQRRMRRVERRRTADGARVAPPAGPDARGGDPVVGQAVAVEISQVDEPGGGGKRAAVGGVGGAQDEEGRPGRASQAREDDRQPGHAGAARDRVRVARRAGGAKRENARRRRHENDRGEEDEATDGARGGSVHRGTPYGRDGERGAMGIVGRGRPARTLVRSAPASIAPHAGAARMTRPGGSAPRLGRRTGALRPLEAASRSLFLLEQCVECVAGAGRPVGGRPGGDDAAAGGVEDRLGAEQRAVVGGDLGDDAGRDLLAALETGPGIEVDAVAAAMQRGVAFGASGPRLDRLGGRLLVPALEAAHHQARLARHAARLAGTPRTVILLALLLALLLVLRVAVAGLAILHRRTCLLAGSLREVPVVLPSGPSCTPTGSQYPG